RRNGLDSCGFHVSQITLHPRFVNACAGKIPRRHSSGGMTCTRSGEFDAAVVGSGPNGLAAAVALARAGLRGSALAAQASVDGAARSLDRGPAPGISHVLCSAVQALAAGSPISQAFAPEARGVGLVVPEASYAQPLRHEPAALAW